ncbi:MAG: hypothetical protein ACJ74O_01460 [Frankiaceae bacterium]
MLRFFVIVVLLWILLGIIGFVVHGLFWLFIIACVLFVLTLLVSAFRGGRRGRMRAR